MFADASFSRMPRRISDCILDYVPPPDVTSSSTSTDPNCFQNSFFHTSKTYSNQMVVRKVFVPPEIEQIIEAEQHSPASKLTPLSLGYNHLPDGFSTDETELLRSTKPSGIGCNYSVRVVRSSLRDRVPQDPDPGGAFLGGASHQSSREDIHLLDDQ